MISCWVYAPNVAPIGCTGQGPSSDGDAETLSQQTQALHNAAPEKLVYVVQATNAVRNRKVQSDTPTLLQGVPAEPVDSFVWNGEGSEPIHAQLELKVDPVANEGRILATWTDEHGSWRYEQTAFSPPSHPAGTQIGPSVTGTVDVVGDPITTNVYLHGDTGSAGPVFPTVFNLLATWGPAQVTLNGQAFENVFDGPAPLWVGHTMTMVGVRGADRTMRTTSDGIYNPSLSDEGASDGDDLEVHLIFHDAPMPATTNIPPPFSFFYYLVFEDVTVSIQHRGD